MSNVRLKPVDKDNYKAVISLNVHPEQKDFVASNVFSIAQAYVHKDFIPKAIMVDDLAVGFLMYTYNDDDCPDMCAIIRFMIDKKYQKLGYGKEALLQLKEQVAGDKMKGLGVTYKPDNKAAARLYASIGMIETGRFFNGEKEAILRF